MASAVGLSDLLLRWEDQREQGAACSAEELCGSRPELVEPLRQRIRAVESMERRLGMKGSPVATIADCPNVPGYEMLEVLDSGGMGIVYKVRHIKLNRLVALKTILGARAPLQQQARFGVEAEAVARLQHPNIVQIYEVGEAEGRPYFSMELVEGGSLAHQLAGQRRPAAEAATLIETLARAIHYAHERGIVHRDLKPANILLSAERGTRSAERDADDSAFRTPRSALRVAKIADFGLAKRLDAETRHTQSGAIMGTPGYMAPEQAGGKEEVSPAADTYALGAILYELLTGRPPFRGESALDTLLQVRTDEPVPPRRHQPKVPRDLETICLKCLAKKPEQRYGSALALADDLRCFLDGRPIAARCTSSWERAVKMARRRPERTALVGVLALALLGVIAVAASHSSVPQETRLTPEKLAPEARHILRKYCYECHGLDPDNAERGLNVLDYAQLVDARRKLVVPGGPGRSRLLLRIVDESMPPPKAEELPRLGPEELQILKDWIAGGAPPFGATSDERPPLVDEKDRELASAVKEIFHERCYPCHKYDNAQGGIKIMNHDLLVAKRKVVVPGRPQDSELFLLVTGRAKPVMPPPGSHLSGREIDTVERWIAAGAPVFPRSR